MPNVSIIGAGPAGMIAAYALLRDGHDVTVYSDKTPDQWLNHSTPTGTAYLYAEVIDIERELGMDYWSQDMFEGHGVLLDFKPEIEGPAHMAAAGRFSDKPGGAIDQRMRVSRWLADFEAQGGRLVVETVTAQRADEIAAASDVTLLAAGKGDLGKVIPRDASRSVYDRPQRNLCMAIVEGVSGWDDRIDFTPVKFNFFGDTGEYFWVPYTHKTAGPTWCFLFEAKAGGAMDVFGDVTDGHQAVAAASGFIEKHVPWEIDCTRDMRLVDNDDYAWLKGRFPPTVREAYGRLPSGGLIMPVGDTAITFDPIGGQGGNTASRNAKYVADAITARGDGPFDEAWMKQVFEGFWDFHGKWAYAFNNILLEPLTEAGQLVLREAASSREFGDRFFGNFPKPAGFFPWMEDAEEARKVVAQHRALAA